MTRKEAMHQMLQENTLIELGFTGAEAEQLRRISMRLHRWYEQECGIDGGCIERDDATGKPFWLVSATGHRYAIRDAEKGAQRRLAAIMARHPQLTYYLQTDPRGNALYLLQAGDVPEGADVQTYYTRGICVC